MYVPSRVSHGYRDSCSIRTLTPRCCNSAGLAGYMSQPHFEASVKMRLALPKVGTWSPPELPRFQGSITGVKTPRLEMFFIPLRRF
jgi:hypothetical protein